MKKTLKFKKTKKTKNSEDILTKLREKMDEKEWDVYVLFNSDRYNVSC